MVNRSYDRAVKGCGTNVELTVKSLHGIEWRMNPQVSELPPLITATVAFTGSASHMEISSSTLCPRTGRLVIETDSMDLDTEPALRKQPEKTLPLLSPTSTTTASSSSNKSIDAEDTKKCFRMAAGFHDAEEGRRSPPVSESLSSSSFPSQPHLRLELPSHDPNIPFIPLSKSNRDSRVFLLDREDPNGRMKPEEETTGTLSEITKVTTELPEIVEFHVTLRESEGSEVFQVGIAHLVLFGNQKGNGPYILDLPIKKKKCGMPSPSRSTTLSSIQLEASAYLRVQVGIIFENSLSIPLPPPRITSPEQVWEQGKLGGIMEQLRQGEECAARRAKAARWGFLQRNDPITAPADEGAADENGSFKNKKITKKSSSSRMLSCGGLEWKQSVQSLVEAVRGCNMNHHKKVPKKRAGGKQIWPTTHGYGFGHHSSFVASTIATRESMEL